MKGAEVDSIEMESIRAPENFVPKGTQNSSGLKWYRQERILVRKHVGAVINYSVLNSDQTINWR